VQLPGLLRLEDNPEALDVDRDPCRIEDDPRARPMRE